MPKTWNDMTDAEKAEIIAQEDARESYKEDLDPYDDDVGCDEPLDPRADIQTAYEILSAFESLVAQADDDALDPVTRAGAHAGAAALVRDALIADDIIDADVERRISAHASALEARSDWESERYWRSL